MISAKTGCKYHKFLIDTGSSISLLPFQSDFAYLLRPTIISLANASGDKIKTYGEISIEIGIEELRRTFMWSFVVADITQPILGTDFLAASSLIVDCKNNTIFDPSTDRKIKLQCSYDQYSDLNVCNFINDNRAENLLSKYPNLTSPLQFNCMSKSDSSIEHFIDTNSSPPIFSKSRPLTGDKLKAAKQEFQFLLNAGIIRRSKSPWASPLHLVPKKEPGTWRPCGDYRRLNTKTVDDKYPVPHLRSLTMSLHGKSVFSKLDLKKAYLQIPMAQNDIPKTAVCTPFGLFEYLYMPYGLKNAGSTFQRLMDSLFANIPNAFIYLDDILVASESEAQHITDLDKVFSILSSNNLKLSIEKCDFFRDSLTFLGYKINSDGVRPPIDRIEAITKLELPKTSTDLRRFMGMINFFRPAMKNFAYIAFHVTELLRINPKSKELKWTQDSIDSFNNLKQLLSTCDTLTFPSPKCTNYLLVTDSSSYAIGAALYQMIDSKPYPVGFFSKKLSDSQKVLSTYDRELLAAFLATLHFKSIIDGHSVTLFLDHKPIVSAFYSPSLAKSDRQKRQLSLISEYISNVEYIRGDNNIVADCLSRPVCAINIDCFDLNGIANAQKEDSELHNYSNKLHKVDLTKDLYLMCDKSTDYYRPYVPVALRSNIISYLHKLSHPGVKNTSKIVKARYYWPNIDKDVKTFVKNCLDCQKSKINKHTHSPVLPISTPTDRFATVHIDIVGPLTEAKLPNYAYPLPYKYLLTCIDRSTRWTEAIPLIDTTASSVAIAFVSGWISRFGVPVNVITDRGSQFESELFAEISSIIGFNHMRTTSYHPQSNGMIERHHRSLKAAIRARNENWYFTLPIALLGYRLTPNASGFSPFSAVTGSQMLCPQPILDKNINIESKHETIKAYMKEMHALNFHELATGDCHSLPKSYVPNDLLTCSKVWMRVDRIRNSLDAPYSGPYDVIKRHSKYFIVDLPQGKTTVSIDRLKPAYVNNLKSKSDKSISVSTDTAQPSITDPPIPLQSDITQYKTRSGRNVKFKHDPNIYYY